MFFSVSKFLQWPIGPIDGMFYLGLFKALFELRLLCLCVFRRIGHRSAPLWTGGMVHACVAMIDYLPDLQAYISMTAFSTPSP